MPKTLKLVMRVWAILKSGGVKRLFFGRRWTDARSIQLIDRRARLMRWAELLEREPERWIVLLPPTWTLSRNGRSEVDVSGSAIEVAYRDPVFRIAGFRAATLPEVQQFFGLSDEQLDRILAASWEADQRLAWQVAHRIRNVADPTRQIQLFIAAMLLAALIVGVANLFI